MYLGSGNNGILCNRKCEIKKWLHSPSIQHNVLSDLHKKHIIYDEMNWSIC